MSKTYIVLKDGVEVDGAPVEVGAEVELDAEAAKPLEESGAVEAKPEDAGESEVDAEAVKALIESEMSEIMSKKIDSIAESIATKFHAGVAKQRAKALATGKKADDPARGDTRAFMKALFAGDMAYMKATGYIDAASESASAGVTVPPELLAEVLRIAETQFGLARREFRYLPFSGPGNSRTIPALGTGIVVNWTDEAAKKKSTRPTFSLVTQTLKKLTAIVPMTEEILEDSAINLTQLVAQMFAEAVSKEEDLQFFNGDGTVWTGILHSDEVNEVFLASTDPDDLTADLLLDMIDATPSGALAGAKFYMHRSWLSKVRKLREGNGTGDYIFQRPGAGLPAQIWDYPYETSDAFPSVAEIADGEGFILFGNLRQAAIFGDKQQIRVKLLDQATVGAAPNTSTEAGLNLAEQDMVALRLVERVGYVLALPQAVTVLKAGTGS